MKKNIVFYCHNFGGLGHIQRLSLIIHEITKKFGDFYNVIFLNSGKKQDFLFKGVNGIKVINLPNYEIIDYKIVNPEKIFLYRQKILEKLFSIGNIEKVIIEHYPFGRNFLDKEIRGLISIFKNNNKEGVLISSVRDIFDINSLNTNNLELFDRFLIHGDKNIINNSELLPKNIYNKIIYTGYVVDKSLSFVDNEDFILISLGGGQDGLEYVLDFLGKVKSLKNSYKIYINLGLNYTDENLFKIDKIGLKNLIIKDYFDNFLELKNKAKIIVSMGGYNSFIENIYYKKISIIYPRETDLEQINRLDSFKVKFKNIFDARELTLESLKNIISLSEDNSISNINLNGAYFSASFISNYKKYNYIKIRLTNACNARCDMCGVIKRKREYNDINNLKDSIIDFYKLGGDIVNFTGGEPTIYKGFWNLLKLSKGLGMITSVSTNGSTLGNDFFEKMYYKGVKLIDYIDISVDGLFEMQDNRRKYKGLFQIIEDNLKRLIDNNIFVHINITIRKDNILEIGEIFDYFIKYGVNSISFGMIDDSLRNNIKHLIPKREDLEKFYFKDKEYILNNSLNTKIIISPDFTKGDFNLFCNSICLKNSFKKKIGSKCTFINGKKEIRINEGGIISPCCEIDNFDEGIGNINNNRLLDIICSRNYENFLNRKQPDISKACLNCKIEI